MKKYSILDILNNEEKLKNVIESLNLSKNEFLEKANATVYEPDKGFSREEIRKMQEVLQIPLNKILNQEAIKYYLQNPSPPNSSYFSQKKKRRRPGDL
jgi:hypothetical protein